MIDYINSINDSLTSIHVSQFEAEIMVVEAMIEAYDKAVEILENYRGEDTSCFDIFAESWTQEAESTPQQPTQPQPSPQPVQQQNGNQPKSTFFRRVDDSGKMESIIMSIIAALPRIVIGFINYLKNSKNEVKVKKIEVGAQQYQQNFATLPQEQKISKFDKVMNTIVATGETITGGVVCITDKFLKIAGKTLLYTLTLGTTAVIAGIAYAKRNKDGKHQIIVSCPQKEPGVCYIHYDMNAMTQLFEKTAEILKIVTDDNYIKNQKVDPNLSVLLKESQKLLKINKKQSESLKERSEAKTKPYKLDLNDYENSVKPFVTQTIAKMIATQKEIQSKDYSTFIESSKAIVQDNNKLTSEQKAFNKQLAEAVKLLKDVSVLSISFSDIIDSINDALKKFNGANSKPVENNTGDGETPSEDGAVQPEGVSGSTGQSNEEQPPNDGNP